ncbi:ABC transporter permease [Perlabentimonas gracilis]|uniref:ABC transporter permease n=1 Tax=Perlabentimonas gracilis TaxID=2715279 RepID=UPI00140CE2CE|nr:ABC transporter permease [Perlabentimonas gracilis]NHB67558.1 ABC transporter permease [Perlabentimonas gracilis]
MRTFFNLLKWDVILLLKYGILPIALGIGALYIGLVFLLDIPSSIIVLLIFSDPSMMGFIFVGVMVLFEKQAGTSSALVVTPLQPWQYLLSKSISLSIPAAIVSLAIVFASQLDASYVLVMVAVVLTSILFLLLGFVGAQRVKTFNQYILIIPMFLMPFCIPLVDFFGLWQSQLMWIIPTHSSLKLLTAAFETIAIWEVLLSVSILLISIYLAWRWALRVYRAKMIEAS